MDSLQGDGICDVLLHLLWTKDELGYGPSIWVPDTVVYKFGQPTVWYFTGLDGKLKRKHKQNLVNVKIEEAFNKSATSDIVACYISEDPKHGTTMEYFDRGGLNEFLYSRWKENNGLLQRFIESKGTKNAVVRAIWSPKVCLLERRANRKHLHDSRYGFYERAVTYEGPEHFSDAAPLRGATFPTQIQRICDNLQAHVAEVSFRKHRIIRLVAHFKIDAKDKVWLLWTSSIRLAPERDQDQKLVPEDVVNIDSIVKLPPHVELVDKANHSDVDASTIAAMSKKSWCSSCGKVASAHQFHPVQYKVIISHFEQLVALLKIDAADKGVMAWPPDPTVLAAAGNVGLGNLLLSKDKKKVLKEIDLVVPPMLRQAHPKLTVAAYRKYKRDPLFLYKTLDVCEDCFLFFAELTSAYGNGTSALLQKHNMQPAKPEDCVPLPRPPKPIHKKRLPPAPKRKEQPTRKDHVQEAPSLPPAIYSVDDSHNYFPAVIDAPCPAVDAAPCPAVDDDVVVVRKREEAFFRDLYADGRQQLPKGHPLAHMVTSHAILQSMSSKPPTTTMGGVGNKKTRKSPYSQKPVLVDSTALPQQQQQQQKSDAATSSPSVGELTKPRRTKNKGLSYTPSASAIQHREFLLKTLEDAQRNLETPNALQAWKQQTALELRREAAANLPSPT